MYICIYLFLYIYIIYVYLNLYIFICIYIHIYAYHYMSYFHSCFKHVLLFILSLLLAETYSPPNTVCEPVGEHVQVCCFNNCLCAYVDLRMPCPLGEVILSKTAHRGRERDRDVCVCIVLYIYVSLHIYIYIIFVHAAHACKVAQTYTYTVAEVLRAYLSIYCIYTV